MAHFLSTKIEFLKGVGPSRGEALNKELKVFNFGDLLRHFPFRYEDRSSIHDIDAIRKDLPFIQIKGKLTNIRIEGSGKKLRLTCKLRDKTGEVELIWFKGVNYIHKILQLDTLYICFGKPSFFNGKYSVVHPEISTYNEQQVKHSIGLSPIYPLTETLKRRRIDSRWIKECIIPIVESPNYSIQEYLPKWIIERYALTSREVAYKEIHLPKDFSSLEKAQKRIKFDELFLLQFKMARLNKSRRSRLNGFKFSKVGSNFHTFYTEHLPFELTNAQKRVIKEIRKDLGSGFQMNRLLQGDVGSGKTIVALLTCLIAMDNGFQSCIMAPTEILATQHFHSIQELTQGMDVQICLLTGSTKKSERNKIHQSLEEGGIHILIGTHALLEDKVKYKNLGLAIIDEQHRFGVVQRSRLWSKNDSPPHVLVMTATPIPRTLAMTVYGDLETSIINELPKGRKPIKTILRNDNDRLKIMHFVKQEIDTGRQVYFVFPLIEESEKLNLKDLMNGYNMVVDHFPLPHYQIGLMHGRLKPDEKDAVMQRFKEGKTNILISTTVIEVGVNVPNSTVMVIENAERFGLSQLHQLRGRVGRGSESSYCILVGSRKLTSNAKERLQALVETNNGFEIAAKDLKIRGPGNIEGTEQSGILDLNLADIIQDEALMVSAREACDAILQSDPDLELPEHSILKQYLQRKDKSIGWSRIS